MTTLFGFTDEERVLLVRGLLRLRDDSGRVKALIDKIVPSNEPIIGETTYQWLIERGQPERQEPTVWLEHSVRHPARDKRWTTNANEAAMFPTREAAEDYIYENFTHPTRGASARAVEHGFMERLDV